MYCYLLTYLLYCKSRSAGFTELELEETGVTSHITINHLLRCSFLVQPGDDSEKTKKQTFLAPYHTLVRSNYGINGLVTGDTVLYRGEMMIVMVRVRVGVAVGVSAPPVFTTLLVY